MPDGFSCRVEARGWLGRDEAKSSFGWRGSLPTLTVPSGGELASLHSDVFSRIEVERLAVMVS